jgi:predicted nucleic-acid-binding protein
MTMRIADTNVLLGLIVDDRPRHAALIEAAIDPVDAPVLITEAVLVESASVLCWSYRYKRSAAAEALLEAISGPGIHLWDRRQAENALRLMRADGALGLVDCLLIEHALASGDEFITFDAHALKRATEYVEL